RRSELMYPSISRFYSSFHVDTVSYQPPHAREQHHGNHPDPRRDPRSQPVVPDAGPEPDPFGSRTGAVPPGRVGRDGDDDFRADPRPEDEDRAGQPPAVPLPHGRRPDLEPDPQPRQDRRERDRLAPARLHPDGRPPPGSRLTRPGYPIK